MERYYIRPDIAKLVGEYEGQFLREGGHAKRTLHDLDESFQQFFRHFPKKGSLRQFDMCDIEDYKEWRFAEGAAYSVVRRELCHLHTFFNWVRSQEGWDDWPQPVRNLPWPPPAGAPGVRTNRAAPPSIAPDPA